MNQAELHRLCDEILELYRDSHDTYAEDYERGREVILLLCGLLSIPGGAQLFQRMLDLGKEL